MIFLLLGVIYMLSGFVQGFLGFGIGVIAVPLVMLQIGIQSATVVHIMIAIIICGINAWLYRRHIHLRMVLLVTAISMVFVPMGIILRNVIPDFIVMISMGLIVMYVAMGRLKKMTSSRRNPATVITSEHFPGIKAFVSSAASGMMSGAFAMSGPPIIAFFYRSSVNLDIAKGNTQLYFTLISIITAVMYLLHGTINPGNTVMAAVLTPVTLLSSAFGVYLSRKIHVDVFNWTVVISMFVFGGWIMLKGLLNVTA